MTEVLVRCVDPQRRDALVESARLVLSFVSVGSGPDFNHFDCRTGLRLVLSPLALSQGCHLAESAQELLEAVQAFGVDVQRVETPAAEISEDWLEWWNALPLASEKASDIELEIR